MKKNTSLIIFLLLLSNLFAQEKVVISGYVKFNKNLEAVLFADVIFPEVSRKITTNEYGFFSIELEARPNYLVKISSVETKTLVDTISGMQTATINFLVEELIPKEELQEVVILAKPKSNGLDNITNTEVSLVKISISEAKMLPAMGGETDVLKVAQLMPGINRGAEGGTNFFVRGGDGDQNLIIVDEATVYNPGHLFGFFSVFNPDVIKEMSIYKGGFPANYSGRLSSITDIRVMDGDKKKFHGAGGIGMLSSRLTLEGPIIKDKMSFMISGRRSYIDQLLKLTGINIPFFFYDLNGKVNYTIGKKDQLFASSYYGNDILRNKNASDTAADMNLNFSFTLGNFTQTLRWTHVFTPKLFSYLSVVYTRFKYNIQGSFVDVQANELLIKSAIKDLGVRYDFQYFKNAKTKFLYGIQATNHNFRPSIVNTSGEISEYLKSKEGALIRTVETNAYADVKYDINNRWKIQGGISIPMSFSSQKTYAGLSPRFNATYVISEYQSVKGSFSRMYQFMHRVSSSSIALPTDLWYPISQKVKPQISDQVALSYNMYFPKLNTSFVIEGYYKYMQHLTEYKEGSQLILNDNFEELLIQGKGWGTGIEFLLRKESGKLTGWIGYTLSWTKRKFDGLNNGEAFWAKYDRRHYLTNVLIYTINKRLSFSCIFELSTGARFTPIIGQYVQPNAGLTKVEIIPIYAERNSVKMSLSHRLDINFIIKSKQKKKNKRLSSEWHLGAYNVYNRATPYQVKISQDPETGKVQYEQPGLFGFIPSIGWNFKF
ncbi:TonB-dependent Receptor Plug Domain protein [compost metagenome]